MFYLRGPIALSHFRIERLLAEISYHLPQVNELSAEYVHFVDAEGQLSKEENDRLSDLLRYGVWTTKQQGWPVGKLILVVPRIGTCSPWSSKATDIAQHGGLPSIRRIERGIAYFVEASGKLTWGDLQGISEFLHDPRTETVLYGLEEAAKLFTSCDAKALPTVSSEAEKPRLFGYFRPFEEVSQRIGTPAFFETNTIELREAIYRLLKLPAIGDKSFLITVIDRSVTGLVVRDQMVGPWQVPVADCAVTARDFEGMEGDAMAMGERPWLALIEPAASIRMSIGEAITNIAAACIGVLSDVRLTVHWMATSGYGDEDARLYEAVQAVGLELCPSLNIPMLVIEEKPEVSSSSPVISALAPVMDIRRSLTPLLEKEGAETQLIFIDLSKGKQRLGGSSFAQVYHRIGNEAPNLEDPILMKAFFSAIQQLNSEEKILAYHDRSDGGLLVTLCEMAFASHTGLDIDISALGEDPKASLFNEELGVVIQVRLEMVDSILQLLNDQDINDCFVIGSLTKNDRITIIHDDEVIFSDTRIHLQKAWAETSYHLQALRDNPRTSKKQFDTLEDREDPGLNTKLTFDLTEDIAAPFIKKGLRPKIAILREQGVNGQVEMAAAFYKAGFNPIDVQTNDLKSGEMTLADFQGLAVCGGFSYGDVLGAGRGWSKRILYDPKLYTEFENYFTRLDTFTLGVGNGCQCLAGLKSIIPGADLWPSFVRNHSEQFESRLCLVEINESPSILLKGMQGSRLLVVVAHSEGQTKFIDDESEGKIIKYHLALLRYVDSRGRKTNVYRANPNASALGITGLTTLDGRVTIMMPHPERGFRKVQYSWAPKEWGEEGPWLQLFRNARAWIGG